MTSMSKKPQRGMATLITTALLLLIALVVALGGYKSTFYEIKRAQNEVLSRQMHWLAEGGIECGLAINRMNPSIPPLSQNYSLCQESAVTVEEIPNSSTEFTLSALAKGTKEIKRTIQFQTRYTGAIQARSDLMLIGSYYFTPELTGIDTCVSVRYQNALILRGAFKTKSPSLSTPCHAMMQTDTSLVTCPASTANGNCVEHGSHDVYVNITGQNDGLVGDGKLLENDFVYTADLDPFQSFFGKPRSELESVKSDFEIVAGTLIPNALGSCQERIRKAFEFTDKVWVEGDCDLEDGSSMTDAKLGWKPKVLVVENGVLAVRGSHTFTGMIYHLFTSGIGDMTKRWDHNVSSSAYIPVSLTTTQKENLVFMVSGSFKPTGGYVLDTPGGMSVFDGAVDLDFDRAAIPDFASFVKWKKGAWRDF
ncbi:hypothetical protein ACE1OE_15665 [Vibrio sp. E150_011]